MQMQMADERKLKIEKINGRIKATRMLNLIDKVLLL
jgi:hypothetical protein